MRLGDERGVGGFTFAPYTCQIVSMDRQLDDRRANCVLRC